MTLSSYIRLAVVVLAVLIIGLVATRGQSEVAATSLANKNEVTLSNSAFGFNADTTTYVSFSEPDAIFAANINFIPPAFGIGVLDSEGGDIVVNDLIGRLESRSLLGFFLGTGAGCNAPTNVDFDLRAASVDPIGVGIVDKAEIGAVNPDGSGRDDQFQSLQDDDGDYNNDGDVDDTGFPYFESGTTYPDANGIADGVERWPSYIIDTFDFNGNGLPDPNELPLFRAIGLSDVSTTTVALQFLLFDLGQLQNAPTAPAKQMVAGLGYPNVTILQDPGSAPQPGPITDFCTSVLTKTVTCGTVDDDDDMFTNGCTPSTKVVRTNPTADTGVAASAATNTHIFYTYNAGQRDADNDGIDNTLDTCVFEPDNDGDGIVEDLSDRDRDGISDGPDPTPFNPRNGFLGGDSEGFFAGDLIPDGCDPAPTVNVGVGDHDFDSFSNPLDNCPTTPNLNQSSGSQSAGSKVSLGEIKGSLDIQAGGQPLDMGSGSDAIGAACDDSDGDGDEDGAGAGTCTDGIDNSDFLDDGMLNGSGDGDVDGNDLDCSAVEGTGAAFVDGSCDDNLDNNAVVTGEKTTAALDRTETDVDVTDATPFTVGDLIIVDTELMEITNITGNTLTVIRGLRAAGGATHFTDRDVDISDGLFDTDDPACQRSDGVDLVDTDDDNDGIPDITDDTAAIPDGHYHKELLVIPVCIGDTDTDLDGWCDATETALGSSTSVNPAETGTDCANGADDDGDGYVNDGCPSVGTWPETALQCTNALNDDVPAIDFGEAALAAGDQRINDGCPAVGGGGAETACGTDSVDDDLDGFTNDGCPSNAAPETGARCFDDVDSDGDGDINDGCPIAYPIPGVGTPENSIIDYGLDPVVVTCSDGIDNDGDTNVDDADATCPEDTDGDSLGIGDNQGLFLRDVVEWFLGINHLKDCAADTITDNEITDSTGLDFDDDADVDGSDLFLFAERFGTTMGDPPPIGKKRYSVRFDVFPDFEEANIGDDSRGGIDGGDLFVFAKYFGGSCTPSP